MGASVAYHLLRVDPTVDVEVIDRDLSLERSSTIRSDGNVRVQFDLEENIAISLYALEVLERFGDEMAVGDHRPNVAMKKQGNLFLIEADGENGARQAMERQRRLGARVEWLDGDEIADRYPPLASDRFVGGTLGPDDGSVDPGAVVAGYRRKAESMGARFVEADVESLVSQGGRVAGIRLADARERRSDVVVVCAGAWSPELLESADISIPVEPVMRTVYVVSTDVAGDLDLPSVFLPSGVYLIPEHRDTFLIAWSKEDDPIGFDFTPADRDRFYDLIWPELVAALPAFDRLEVKRSWAGLYAQNRLDANAIVGEWPGLDGLYMATGFSGHGFQQCHAVGRYLAEKTLGLEPFLDLSRFGPGRILSGEPVFEHAGRII